MLPTKPAVHVKLAKEVFKGQAEGPGPHDDLAEVILHRESCRARCKGQHCPQPLSSCLACPAPALPRAAPFFLGRGIRYHSELDYVPRKRDAQAIVPDICEGDLVWNKSLYRYSIR